MDSRQTFLHIAPHWPFYALALIAVTLFVWGVWRHLARWLTAVPERRWDKPGRGLAAALVDGLLGRAVFRNNLFSGLIHTGLAWGFILLFLGTVGLTIDEYLTPWLSGPAYVVFSFILDLAGLVFSLAAAAALIRRLVGKPARLENLALDLALPGLLLIIALSGFLLEAVRLAAQPPGSESYAFIGQALSGLVSGRPGLYIWLWWLHAVAALGLITIIPFTKLSHLVAAPVQLYQKVQPVRALGAEEFLVALRPAELAASACTRCGRCTELCPVVVAGESFNPRGYLAQLRERDPRPAETLWHCSTCRACEAHCPLGISPPALLTRERGRLVEEGTELPPEGIEALESIHKFKNPWGAPRRKKADWVRKTKAPNLARLKREVETLYFVGCTASVETRANEIAKSMAALLTRADEDWATLADKEPCCGDAARIWGELGLYEECYLETVEALAGQSRRIVCTSPHCLHTMSGLYPGLAQALAGDILGAPVEHYSTRLAALLDQGRLKPGPSPFSKITFHDPCYLGRWSGEYEAPRRVLAAIPGLELKEMTRNRDRAFCCGGGGGRVFQDFEAQAKPAELRLAEAAATGAQALVTACPICLIMFTDAAKTSGLEDKIQIIDLAELLAACVRGKGD